MGLVAVSRKRVSGTGVGLRKDSYGEDGMFCEIAIEAERKVCEIGRLRPVCSVQGRKGIA